MPEKNCEFTFIHRTEKNTEYHAKMLENECLVTWQDSKGGGSVTYTHDDVLRCLSKGIWVLQSSGGDQKNHIKKGLLKEPI